MLALTVNRILQCPTNARTKCCATSFKTILLAALLASKVCTILRINPAISAALLVDQSLHDVFDLSFSQTSRACFGDESS
jgi:hypothetical protein